MEIHKGEIYMADLGDCSTGSEQSGRRPVVIIQNDIGNRYSPTVIVACLTSKIYKTTVPTHVRINGGEYGMQGDSLVLCEQIKTIDKSRLESRITRLNMYDRARIDDALRISLAV